MKLRRLCVVMMVGAALGAAACSDDDPIDVQAETFATIMTGFQETPAVNTSATGTAEVVFTPTSLTYSVSVTNLQNMTNAHIHTSQTGGVVLSLNPTTTVTTGVIASGTATTAQLNTGFTMDSLKAIIRNGNAYVNVHNTANPGGHIRGQLVRTN